MATFDAYDFYAQSVFEHMEDLGGQAELSYKTASKLVKELNKSAAFKYIVIVLTISHLNHDITDNREENLKALCQKCHNSHDVAHRKHTRKLTRDKKNGQIPIFEQNQDGGE